MTAINKKHSLDSVVNPDDFIKYIKSRNRNLKINVPANIVLCFQKSFFNRVISGFELEPSYFPAGEMYCSSKLEDDFAVVGNFGIGAPAAVCVAELLVASGARRIISVGTAGAISQKLKPGDILVCNKALRGEGTSKNYLRDQRFAHAGKEITDQITDTLNQNKLFFNHATSWTTDAPYRETGEEILKYSSEGISVVEMEAAALFAVAEYRKVQLGCILTVSDLLFDLCWKPCFHYKDVSESLYQIATTAINCFNSNK